MLCKLNEREKKSQERFCRLVVVVVVAVLVHFAHSRKIEKDTLWLAQ